MLEAEAQEGLPLGVEAEVDLERDEQREAREGDIAAVRMRLCSKIIEGLQNKLKKSIAKKLSKSRVGSTSAALLHKGLPSSLIN